MRTNRQTAVALVLAFIMFSSGTMVFDVSESDANPANVIEVSYDHGQIIDKATGLEYKGGEFLGEITLQFIPNRGYEFISWHVNGSAVYSTALNEITITSVQGTITVTVTLRNYSTSQELINVLDVDDLPDPDDELVLAWSFKSTQLEKSGGMWKGMPSVDCGSCCVCSCRAKTLCFGYRKRFDFELCHVVWIYRRLLPLFKLREWNNI